MKFKVEGLSTSCAEGAVTVTGTNVRPFGPSCVIVMKLSVETPGAVGVATTVISQLALGASACVQPLLGTFSMILGLTEEMVKGREPVLLIVIV